MLRTLLLVCFLTPVVLGIGTQSLLSADSGIGLEEQGDIAPTAASCVEMLDGAISLNENFKRAVSAGGQRAFGLEVGKNFHDVLMKRISGCVSLASAQKDAVLSRRIIDLAYSYSNLADEKIRLEAARLYAERPEMIAAILMDFGSDKRPELIEILRSGLVSLFSGKPEEAERARMLTLLLGEPESK
ncbi:MAG: hypothetical protein QUT30_00155 [Acidobacteriota bacterium]|nr:hypothetical protein [Acidobacteriota bacterium]